jgi:uncharacterized delta-60 repeat protein
VLVVLALLFTAVLSLAGMSGADPLDPSFGASGVATVPLPQEASQKEASIVDFAAAPNGTTVGALKGLAGPGYFGAVRLTPAGAPDPSFGRGGFTLPLPLPPLSEGFNFEAQAEAVAVQQDGKAVVAGFLQEGLRDPTTFTPLVARYQADGSLDPGFGAGGIALGRRRSGPGGTVLHAADIAAEGRIIVVGGRNELRRGVERPAGLVYAYKLDGSLDRSFGRRGSVLFSQRDRRTYTSLHDVEVLGNGRILVAGYHRYRAFLARLHGDGRLDRGFGGGDGSVTLGIHNGTCCPPAALAVQGNGRIVVAANGGPFHTDRVYLVRYRPNGSLDRGFGKGGIAAPFLPWRLFRVHDVAVQGDGGILTVGPSAKTKRNAPGGAYAVFRNEPDGSPDRSFGNQGLLTVAHGEFGNAAAALARPDGGVLTGGSFLTVDQGSGRYVTTLLFARFLG